MAQKKRRGYRRLRQRTSAGESFAGVFAIFAVALLGLLRVGVIEIPLGMVIALALLIILVAVGFFALFRIIERERKERAFRAIKDIGLMHKMGGYEFEHFAGWIFERHGCTVDVVGKSGDHGIDLVMMYQGKPAVAQVKCYRPDRKITEEMIREFYGSHVDLKPEHAFYVTTSSFTAKAVEYALPRNIHLIDGKKLAEVLASFNRPSSWWQLLLSRAL
jgi:HJR/Mrr/RecB family endonuclease